MRALWSTRGHVQFLGARGGLSAFGGAKGTSELWLKSSRLALPPVLVICRMPSACICLRATPCGS